ncbi:MAG: bacteriohemerythrin [Desulfoprunum sp.]|nr:bacteriohemerythrin [Desulfoprunum sp.]
MKNISIIWTPDLEVGIKEIDDQHRQLFSLLAAFYTNLQKGAGREIIAKMLEDLMTHAGAHFKLEESFLQAHPDLIRHHQLHYDFIKQMGQFERDYLQGDISLAVDIVTFVIDWLHEHIVGIDKQYFLDLQKAGE